MICTPYIRGDNDERAGVCGVASRRLTLAGGSAVVAYLGCAWGEHVAVDAIEQAHIQHADLGSWLGGVGYARAVEQPVVADVSVAAYLYSSRTPRTGADIGGCSVASVPVYSVATGRRAAWFGSARHGTPDGNRWARIGPGDVDQWLSDRGLRLKRESSP